MVLTAAPRGAGSSLDYERPRLAHPITSWWVLSALWRPLWTPQVWTPQGTMALGRSCQLGLHVRHWHAGVMHPLQGWGVFPVTWLNSSSADQGTRLQLVQVKPEKVRNQ